LSPPLGESPASPESPVFPESPESPEVLASLPHSSFGSKAQ